VDDHEIPGRIRDIRAYRPSFVGLALLACTPFLIFGAISVYGVAAAVGLTVLWLLLVTMGCLSFQEHPRRVLVAGVVSLVAWLVVVIVAR
jgi:amino acid permease